VSRAARRNRARGTSRAECLNVGDCISMRFCARACCDTSANELRYTTGTFRCNDMHDMIRDKKELR
jgi:hypothetical protein